MNRRLSRLGVALMLCYVALFGMLNWVQVLNAEELNDNPINRRTVEQAYDRDRGRISTIDGAVVARSTETAEGDRFRYQREYPEGELFAHTVGWLSFEFGAEGVEREYNDELAGLETAQQFTSFEDLFVESDVTGDVQLSLRYDVQQTARAALGERAGSVVAVDPRTGAVLAMWSWPSFDPNLLASHDLGSVRDAREALLADDGDPLLPKAYRESYAPGSTFKIVTAAIGVENDLVTRDEPVYPVRSEYVPALTSVGLGNFGGAACGGALFEIIRASCNTAFAEMGAETIGPDLMIEGAQRYGFGDQVPVDLPAAAASSFPDSFGAVLEGDGGPGSVVEDTPGLAQASFGQGSATAVPLHLALVAGSMGTGGEVMRPYVVERIFNADGEVIDEASPEVWRQPVSASTAELIRESMIFNATSGTATGMQVAGFEVGGKTGTAEVSTDPLTTHAWIVGFGGPPGEEPTVAVSVIVEADEAAGQQTGGRTAAPIAQAVLQQALQPFEPVQVTPESSGEGSTTSSTAPTATTGTGG
ncbi:MAG: penicillin-binding transpeptidase domain-containing protein [Actinomycetota bacterium]|nr:penicillin-binding transpeptidase domain-containing protein [Actinomycetota bacterium]